MNPYKPSNFESSWQKTWEETKLYHAVTGDAKPKYYYLFEFPYPSGDGLHVGHLRPYVALDVMARLKRMQGYNVLFPIGWDAFGLPTENYAIKHKIAPQLATERNVATFKRQVQMMGVSVDWSREINTTDPSYYKWTQWIFLRLLEKNLAYQAEMPINWCPFEKTGLANEEVVNGIHERCGTPVEKKLIKQWVLRITAYADRLIDDLKTVDYLNRIATEQINWIGRSTGAEITFALNASDGLIDTTSVTVYTTRPDTLYGATFIVVSPELAHGWMRAGWKAPNDVGSYISIAINEQELVRQERKDKTGVATGLTAVHPLTGRDVPVWVADYVLGGYGTGAIMAVPAHDQRDAEFAAKFNLPVIEVIDPTTDLIINSDTFNGLTTADAKAAVVARLEADNTGKSSTKYKLRDWIFSRQHYWGEPIPVIHCANDGVVPVPTDQLPVTLPEVEYYEPTDTGESPLAAIESWVNTTCPKCGKPARRETDTMPNWAGSSWYYLRYMDPHNDAAFASTDALEYWSPVDLYNGGMEHTTLHVLYSRFWHKFLYDEGLVPTSEPYAIRRSHGMILGPDNRKMSKSIGNVINPDHVVERYGADTLRVYEMFMGPFDEVTSWSEERLSGVARFLYRIWALSGELHTTEPLTVTSDSYENAPGSFEVETDRILNKTLQKVGEDITQMHFNTAVSSLMELVNFLTKAENKSRLLQDNTADLRERTQRTLLLILAPFAPHMTEELWHALGETASIHTANWPAYDPSLIQDDVLQIMIQVNGKLRGSIVASADSKEDELVAAAQADSKVATHLEGKEVVKTIIVPGRLINFVVK